MLTVSIVVPVYNARRTLSRSLDSIEAQTYPGVELVVVDDSSSDGSLDLLNSFKKRFEIGNRRMIICRHETNKGVASARNTALESVTGDYVMYVDADDYLIPDAVEKVVSVLLEKGSDIVGWDWSLRIGDTCRPMRQSDFSSPEECLKKMFSGVVRWNLWLFIAKRSLYVENQIRFLDGRNMGEDLLAMSLLCMNASRVDQIHELLYEYQQTDSSISRVMTDRNIIDVIENVRFVETAIRNSRFSDMFPMYVNLLKLNIKLPLLISTDRANYIRWFNFFSEANAFIFENRDLPFRTRLLQAMARCRCWGCVKLYNLVVYNLLYKLLY